MSHSKEEGHSQRDPDVIPSTQEYIEPPDTSQKEPELPYYERSVLPIVHKDVACVILKTIEHTIADYPKTLFKLAHCSKALYEYLKPILAKAQRQFIKDIIIKNDDVPMPVTELYLEYQKTYRDIWQRDDIAFTRHLVKLEFDVRRMRFRANKYSVIYYDWASLAKGERCEVNW
jgi:hypothetical protein